MDGTIGTIMLFGGQRCPKGWLPCDGRLLAVSEHQTLFSLVGTSYGGDGRLSFGLPKLAALTSAPPGQGSVGYYICAEGTYPIHA